MQGKGLHRSICMHVLLEKRRRNGGALFNWCLLPKNDKTRFSKCDVINANVFVGSSSLKGRPLCCFPSSPLIIIKKAVEYRLLLSGSSKMHDLSSWLTRRTCSFWYRTLNFRPRRNCGRFHFERENFLLLLVLTTWLPWTFLWFNRK